MGKNKDCKKDNKKSSKNCQKDNKQNTAQKLEEK